MQFSKVLIVRAVIFSVLSGLLALTVSTSAKANYSHRSDNWEASFKLLNNQSFDLNGQNGSNMETESDYGWGFTLGYNVNPHILVNFELSSSTPNYDATVITDDGEKHNISHTLTLVDSQFNLVYNLFTSQFTPYVQAGAGWSYLDSNVAKGPPGAICWWDPWWGYVCNVYQSTFNDTRFSYNVAMGVRYELDNSVFFRVSYKQARIDNSYSDDANIGSFQLEVGSLF